MTTDARGQSVSECHSARYSAVLSRPLRKVDFWNTPPICQYVLALGAAVSAGQIRRYPILVGQESFYGSPSRRNARVHHCLVFQAPVTEALLCRLLEQAVSQHDSLRVVFQESGEGRSIIFRDTAQPADWLSTEWSSPDDAEDGWQESVMGKAMDTSVTTFCAYIRSFAGGGGQVVLAFHHIAADAGTCELVVDGLIAAVANALKAETTGVEASTPPYEDYVKSHANDARDFTAPQSQYWRKLLTGATILSISEADVALAPPNSRAVNTGAIWSLDPAELVLLSSIARAEKVTVPSLINASIAVAAALSTGGSDIVLSCVTAGRPVEFANVTGLFNFRRIYIRLDVQPDSTLMQIASRALQQFMVGEYHSRTAYNAARLRAELEDVACFPVGGEIYSNLIISQRPQPAICEGLRVTPTPSPDPKGHPEIPSSLRGLTMVQAVLGYNGLELEVRCDPFDSALHKYDAFAAQLRRVLSIVSSSSPEAMSAPVGTLP